MTELSSYSLDPSGNVVYTEPQAALSSDEIISIHHYLSVLHLQSGHSQLPAIITRLLLISAALG